MTSVAADPFVRGFEYGRGNADAAKHLINDGPTPLASSDHDGFVLFFARQTEPVGNDTGSAIWLWAVLVVAVVAGATVSGAVMLKRRAT